MFSLACYSSLDDASFFSVSRVFRPPSVGLPAWVFGQFSIVTVIVKRTLILIWAWDRETDGVDRQANGLQSC